MKTTPFGCMLMAVALLLLTVLPVTAQTGNGTARIVKQTVSPVRWSPIENSEFKNFLSPVIFSRSANLYEHPDTNSRVLRVLSFNTNLALIAEGEITGEEVSETTGADGTPQVQTRYTLFKWYEIIAGNEKGYVKAADVACHSLDGDDRSIFFVQCCDAPEYTTKVYKYSPALKTFTDTLRIPFSGGYSVWKIDHTGWKNTNVLFRMTSVQAFCGGGRTDLFVIDAGHTTSVLATSGYNNSEDLVNEPREESVVYLPVRLSNGKILAVESGDLANSMDPFTGSLKIHPFPAGSPVSRQQLIAKKVTVESVIRNGRGQPVKDKTGNIRTRRSTRIIYYEWNGRKLVPAGKPISR